MKVTVIKAKNRYTHSVDYAIIYPNNRYVYVYPQNGLRGDPIEFSAPVFNSHYSKVEMRADVDIVKAIASCFKIDNKNTHI